MPKDGNLRIPNPISYVMHTRGAGLKKVAARVEHDYRSDHDAVVVRYKLGS